MTPQSLQTLTTLCALLLLLMLGHAADARCLTDDQVRQREELFYQRVHVVAAADSPDNQPADSTCERAAREARGTEVNDRALSPWKYRVNSNVSRIPQNISEAVCLCRGCIINGEESQEYNSVPIYVQQKILKITECRTDLKKHVVTREVMEVAVGCTCVQPLFLESR